MSWIYWGLHALFPRSSEVITSSCTSLICTYWYFCQREACSGRIKKETDWIEKDGERLCKGQSIVWRDSEKYPETRGRLYVWGGVELGISCSEKAKIDPRAPKL